MGSETERIIDEAWSSSLARMAKKETGTARPMLGDEVDIFVPQAITLLLLEANPALAAQLYASALASASRNVYTIMKKLGMPADYFWKFEYWPKDRAFETLKRVINKVFSAMMNLNKEGLLDLQDVDVEHMRFTIGFKDCAECAGIAAESGICYYHTATFAGIISALINKEMSGYEAKCSAKKDDGCTFIIGKKDDPEIVAKMTEYLAAPKIATKIGERLDACLQGNPLRGIGNMVNIGYYRLLITQSMLGSSSLSSSIFAIGVNFGIQTASIISAYYQTKNLDIIKKYYNQIRRLDVKATESGSDVEIVLAEYAETPDILKNKEILDFVCGKFQGLVSTLLTKPMAFKESHFDGINLVIKLTLQA